jgi:hypothetical protein
MLHRTNRITSIVTATPGIPVGIVTLQSLLTATVLFPCQNVFLYSPAGDGIYTDNTLPILVGGVGVALGIGFPLLPGGTMSIDIDNTAGIRIFEPSGAGTQILVVLVSS